mmetsp:Transcript_41924/g.133809  ORF Transcript_41924/g.133809 Transcript_41924/m.133809 type:complete len:307 (-) Transcript_41924:399-1319(-)
MLEWHLHLPLAVPRRERPDRLPVLCRFPPDPLEVPPPPSLLRGLCRYVRARPEHVIVEDVLLPRALVHAVPARLPAGRRGEPRAPEADPLPELAVLALLSLDVSLGPVPEVGLPLVPPDARRHEHVIPPGALPRHHDAHGHPLHVGHLLLQQGELVIGHPVDTVHRASLDGFSHQGFGVLALLDDPAPPVLFFDNERGRGDVGAHLAPDACELVHEHLVAGSLFHKEGVRAAGGEAGDCIVRGALDGVAQDLVDLVEQAAEVVARLRVADQVWMADLDIPVVGLLNVLGGGVDRDPQNPARQRNSR